MSAVLITGGSDGIGLATARLLAQGGAHVTLVARHPDKLRDAVATLLGDGHQVITADLSQPSDVERLAREIESRHYDVFINNAGIGQYGRFTELALADQLRMMRLNMDSVVVLSHAYLRQARRGDALVNTASFLAYAPLPGAAVYSATKAFVATLSETLWWEYRPRGVYVLGLSPGIVMTRFHEAAGGAVAAFPRVLLQSPERAAAELVRALRRRAAPGAIAGFATRWMVRLQRLVSRKIAINMMGNNSVLSEVRGTSEE